MEEYLDIAPFHPTYQIRLLVAGVMEHYDETRLDAGFLCPPERGDQTRAARPAVAGDDPQIEERIARQNADFQREWEQLRRANQRFERFWHLAEPIRGTARVTRAPPAAPGRGDEEKMQWVVYGHRGCGTILIVTALVLNFLADAAHWSRS